MLGIMTGLPGARAFRQTLSDSKSSPRRRPIAAGSRSPFAYYCVENPLLQTFNGCGGISTQKVRLRIFQAVFACFEQNLHL
jgi:hypothetical protein